jgi:acyl dehydratase
MKSKDLVMLSISVIIILASAYVGYSQLAPKKAGATAGVQVEVVGNIPSQLDTTGMGLLNDSTKVQDYGSPVDLSGLNNAAPFGQ